MPVRNVVLFLGFLVAPAAQAQIVLERTSCFGTCPAYVVEIRPDGLVLFTGRNQFAVSSGKRKIDSAVADSLAAEIMRSGFVDLAASYKAGEAGCMAYATDHPSITLAVRRGLQGKAVSYDLGCYGDSLAQDTTALLAMFNHPPTSRTLVERLARRVDAVAGVGEWLKKPREDP